MRPPLLVATAAALLGLCCTACGAASKGPRAAPPARLPQIELKTDSELDSDAYGNEPDNESAPIGPPASAADRRAIATLVERYYAAATAGDGQAACRLLYRTFAESVPEDYGAAPARPGLREGLCAAVVSKIFKARHTQLSAEGAAPRVSAVRVNLNKGAARFSAAGTRTDHYIAVHRERGAWKIAMLLGTTQPIQAE